jgi:hypothetical protein
MLSGFCPMGLGISLKERVGRDITLWDFACWACNIHEWKDISSKPEAKGNGKWQKY